ncbi:acetyl-CoA C-acetyltransferase [Janthinobacterium sp. PC23-8]|uniref:acetyl-CoA C-acetyltransferase n=1 Tax=Janthinobacterium sp. PC23-8 TaxID=2012679 RepID=UPI000B968E70|nr:acetyl-CoA C-acetyltransferase [Janthinobacterium sp. PC23-8]OYO26306.1 acetyl-CoA acetyltransferase [Janthinobacterium sp. PC23-8]
MKEAFIYDHVRTPRGKGRPDGALHQITPVQLAAQTLAAIRDRNRFDTGLVDDVILGCVSPVGEQGADIARMAAIMANFDERVTGLQIDRFCASGLEAVNLAAAQIAMGQAQAIVAGGVESMSRVPPMSGGGAWTNDPQAIWKSYFNPTGVSADLLATLDGYTRAQLDGYALASQQRTALAWAQGRFDRSVLPVRDMLGQVVLARDEYPRPDATAESLAALKPAFDVMGEQGGFDAVALQRYPQIEAVRHWHTPGSSSGIVDGAAAILVGSKEFGQMAGLKPRARIVSFASIGSDPTVMLTGPAPATLKALRNAGMSINDIDLFEINEAFSSVVLRYMRALDLPHDRVNVNGGAIAMGHPLGATGAMILGTVLDELERRDRNTAVITLCAAIGQATATIIERV